MQPISAITCGACGTPVATATRFCPQCGVSLSGPLTLASSGPGTSPRSAAPAQHRHPTLTAGTELDGSRYRITRLLNAGSFGAVYHAQNLRLAGHPCAIKELLNAPGQTPAEQAESAAWFQREAELLMSLRHPMIPRIWDRFSEHGRHYLVMDLVPGHNLEQELAARGGPLSEKEVLEWGIALCDVLAYLHAQHPPIVFRDLKPANIMRTPTGSLFLIDFGIARTFGTTGGTLRSGTMIGTPGYAPLEQYQGMAEPRSDIYALGATLHRLLTGYDPEHGQPLTFPPARQLRPDLHPLTEASLAQAVALQPANRFGDDQSFADDLAAARAEVTPAVAGVPSARAQVTRSVAGVPSARGTTNPVQAGKGPVIVVTPDGRGTYASLAEAVAAAPVGATIRLTAGVHRVERGVLLSQAITLGGEGRTSTEIVATQGDYVLRYEGSGLFQLQDLTVRWAGAASKTTDGVSVQEGEVQIERCRFTGAPASGLAVGGTVSGRIAACTADGNGVGIAVGGQSHPSLEGNTCEQNNLAGILYLGMGHAAGTARQNTCRSNEWYGIYVGGQAQPLLEGNTCEQNKRAGILYLGNAAGTARQNVCRGNKWNGINVGEQAQPLLEGNTCEQNKRGILYYESAAGTARQNVCRGNDEVGIWVGGQAQPLLASNICERNGKWDIYTDTHARPTLMDNVAGVNRVYPKPRKKFWS